MCALSNRAVSVITLGRMGFMAAYDVQVGPASQFIMSWCADTFHVRRFALLWSVVVDKFVMQSAESRGGKVSPVT